MRSHPPTDDEGVMNSQVDYTRYWGLQALPFDNVTDPRFYAPCFQPDAAQPPCRSDRARLGDRSSDCSAGRASHMISGRMFREDDLRP